MSTRAFIAIPTPEGWAGSYHHLDGGPPLADQLARLVDKHGPALTAHRYALDGYAWWSIVGSDLDAWPPEERHTGRLLDPSSSPPLTIPGYPRRLHDQDTGWHVAWLHLIHRDGTIESRHHETRSDYITRMEADGQRQIVASSVLPIDCCGDEDELLALGFTFGDPTDDLFRAVTLPDGWSREASDHDMWSYIVDEEGRQRVAIFYKAAFYDRRAFCRVQHS